MIPHYKMARLLSIFATLLFLASFAYSQPNIINWTEACGDYISEGIGGGWAISLLQDTTFRYHFETDTEFYQDAEGHCTISADTIMVTSSVLPQIEKIDESTVKDDTMLQIRFIGSDGQEYRNCLQLYLNGADSSHEIESKIFVNQVPIDQFFRNLGVRDTLWELNVFQIPSSLIKSPQNIFMASIQDSWCSFRLSQINTNRVRVHLNISDSQCKVKYFEKTKWLLKKNRLFFFQNNDGKYDASRSVVKK